MSEINVFGTDEMRMVELALDDVVIRPGWSARGEPSEEEVAKAAERFAQQQMLQPPAVAQRGQGWVLVAGGLRLSVWRHLGYERGVFRWVEGSDQELLLLNLAENIARKELGHHEIAERVTFLRELGISAAEIAKHSGYSARYVRQLAALKRDAHPELWALFVARTPHLQVRVMLDLVAHPPEEQLERWLEAEKHWRRGDTSARGFAENEDEDGQLSGGATPRRRFPKRREVKRLLAAMLAEESIEEEYRKGVIDALRWMLFNTELGTRFSWSTLRAMEGKGAKVIPIRPEVGGPAEQEESPEASGRDS